MLGQCIGGYEIIVPLARGGMAELWIARRQGLEGFQKVVVLKRILPHLAQNPHFVEMFLSEARLAATLEHPNVVHVSDIGRHDDDFFFTMAYVHGKDLTGVLREFGRNQLRLPLAHTLTIAAGLCAGLHYAHEQVDFDGRPLGIVHRDVSPSNVIVTWDGNVKIVDFGIAKAAEQTGVTQVGMRKGKASYMAPEQVLAQPIDRRADVWAIGVILYEMSTMTRLFRDDDELTIMHRIVTGDIPRPSNKVADYPPELEAIVMRCLALEPDERYTTAHDVRLDLEKFAHTQRISMSSIGLGEDLRALFDASEQAVPWSRALAALTDPTSDAKRIDEAASAPTRIIPTPPALDPVPAAPSIAAPELTRNGPSGQWDLSPESDTDTDSPHSVTHQLPALPPSDVARPPTYRWALVAIGVLLGIGASTAWIFNIQSRATKARSVPMPPTWATQPNALVPSELTAQSVRPSSLSAAVDGSAETSSSTGTRSLQSSSPPVTSPSVTTEDGSTETSSSTETQGLRSSSPALESSSTARRRFRPVRATQHRTASQGEDIVEQDPKPRFRVLSRPDTSSSRSPRLRPFSGG